MFNSSARPDVSARFRTGITLIMLLTDVELGGALLLVGNWPVTSQFNASKHKVVGDLTLSIDSALQTGSRHPGHG